MPTLRPRPYKSIAPPLDPDFVSPALWEQAYRERAQNEAKSCPIIIDILRPDGSGKRSKLLSLPETEGFAEINFFRIERLVKLLLWQIGGSRIRIDGPQSWGSRLTEMYGDGGSRAFDNQTIGIQVYGEPLQFESVALVDTAIPSLTSQLIGGHTQGNRIGFDLGGSDRKCAAVVDGEVIFSEEVPWSPYFEKDPEYHINGILDSIATAARHLPQVDAIGGSAAGIYIDNQPRIASLIRGLSDADIEQKIRPFFLTLSSRWNSVPYQVANDGDVTALAGAMMAGEGDYLGIAMGTSMACGYVDDAKRITSMLNELAFVPVDFQDDGPVDEWSGDSGCGVQYFSQQAVVRLAKLAGIAVDEEKPLPEVLVEVQALAERDDQRARKVFNTIGVYLAHALAQFSEHYQIRHVLLLGRVMSGAGGEWILGQAREVLALEFPELSQAIQIHIPDDRLRRHGQAIAAASLAPPQH